MKLKAKLERGYILARVIIEVVGKPREHVEAALKQAIKHIKTEKEGITLKEGDLYKAKEEKDGFFSTFSELELLFKDSNELIGFCFDYVPSSIEILEPKDLKFDTNQLANLINDLLAKLHQLGISLKKLNADNQILTKNATALLNNSITMALGGKEKTAAEISKFTGIPEQQLTPFLDIMVKNNAIKKEGDNYKR